MIVITDCFKPPQRNKKMIRNQYKMGEPHTYEVIRNFEETRVYINKTSSRVISANCARANNNRKIQKLVKTYGLLKQFTCIQFIP